MNPRQWHSVKQKVVTLQVDYYYHTHKLGYNCFIEVELTWKIIRMQMTIL